MALLRTDLIPVEPDIIRSYIDGASSLSLSKKYGVSRSLINRVLRNANVEVRNGSAANKIRFQNSTEAERKAIVKAANKAMRSRPKSFHHLSSVKQAITKYITQSKVGVHEQEVINILSEFNPIPQLPVDVYNIDVACGSVAVEVHVRTGYPERNAYYRKRTIELMKRGWDVIYLVVNRKGLNEAGLNKLYSLVKFASLNPSVDCKYWMVNGTGELCSAFRLDGNDLAPIPTPNDAINAV